MATEKTPRPAAGTGYERLLQEEQLFHENPTLPLPFQDIDLAPPPPYKTGHQRLWLHVLNLSLKAVVVGLAVCGLIALIQATVAFDTNTQEVDCNCGSSVEEAISRGCKYDAMATSWLPPMCRDDELAYEFDHAGPGPNGEWGYYADIHGNVSYTLEEVAMLAVNEKDEDRGFYTTHEWYCNW